MQVYGIVQPHADSRRVIVKNNIESCDLADAIRAQCGNRFMADVSISIGEDFVNSYDARGATVYATKEGDVFVRGDFQESSLLVNETIGFESGFFRGGSNINVCATLQKHIGQNVDLLIKKSGAVNSQIEFEDYVFARAKQLDSLGHVHSFESLLEEWLTKWTRREEIDAEFERIHNGCTNQKYITPGGTSYIAEYGNVSINTFGKSLAPPLAVAPNLDEEAIDLFI